MDGFEITPKRFVLVVLASTFLMSSTVLYVYAIGPSRFDHLSEGHHAIYQLFVNGVEPSLGQEPLLRVSFDTEADGYFTEMAPRKVVRSKRVANGGEFILVTKSWDNRTQFDLLVAEDWPHFKEVPQSQR